MGYLDMADMVADLSLSVWEARAHRMVSSLSVSVLILMYEVKQSEINSESNNNMPSVFVHG